MFDNLMVDAPRFALGLLRFALDLFSGPIVSLLGAHRNRKVAWHNTKHIEILLDAPVYRHHVQS